MSDLLIRGAVVAEERIHARGWVALRDGMIAGVGEGPAAAAPDGFGAGVDVGERLLAPGFVDVHVHGGGGGQAAGDDPEEVAEGVLQAARFHATHGTT